jgi:hypothetical protein
MHGHEPNAVPFNRAEFQFHRKIPYVVCSQESEIQRFEVPNLHVLNFLLHEGLDGGGTLSLNTDAQGKTCSAALFRIQIEVDDSVTRQLPWSPGCQASDSAYSCDAGINTGSISGIKRFTSFVE